MEASRPYSELSKLVDIKYPFTTLLQWADEITDIGYSEDSIIMQKIQTLSTDRFHRQNIRPILLDLVFNPDVTIHTTNGRDREIIQSSDFYPKAFSLLDDDELNKVMEEYDEYLRPIVARDKFISVFIASASVASLIFGPNPFDSDTTDAIVKQSLSDAIYLEPYATGDFRESTFMFYGCMKIWANKLGSFTP